MRTHLDVDVGGRNDTAALQGLSHVNIRMYLSVGSGNGPRPSLSIGFLLPIPLGDGAVAIKAIVANTGARAG